ncbi:hypothetical protein ACFPM7_20885 [Actinokineospora guangxiensis]|uniref:Uncharacterized protein n=1 Tax=Actinokineospora guangxiensis TaxID=1490288 RepID=A0ABW0ETH3_9PSEU
MSCSSWGTGCGSLEVGARAGGAESPILWRELHGFDLNHFGFTTALGEPAPPAGAVLPAAEAYSEHVGGRFRFRGDSTAAVAKIAADYRITGTALG